jgi:hypothetical protein
MIPERSVDSLEKQAADQRLHLHDSVSRLRESVKEKFDVKRRLTEFVWPIAAGMVAVGLVFGYSVGGIFKANRAGAR